MMNFHDYQALEARLNDTDIYTLIADCDTMFAENPTEFMRLLRSALRLSAHVLEADKSALAHQLAGRLYHHVDKNADIKVFVDGIIPPKNSLYPIDNGYDPLLPAGGMLLRMMESIGWVTRVLQLRDGNLLSWGSINDLDLWSRDGKSLKVMNGHLNSVRGAIELKDGRILSYAEDSRLILWDSSGNFIRAMTGHNDEIYEAIQLKNGNLLSQDDSTIHFWDSKGNPITTITSDKKYNHIIELSDGRILLSGFQLRFYDPNGNLLHTTPKDEMGWGNALELQNGYILSMGYQKLGLWDSSGIFITEMIIHEKWVSAIELQNGHILSWGSGKELCLWRIDGTLITKMIAHQESIRNVFHLRDGRIVSVSEFSTKSQPNLCLWDEDGSLIDSQTGYYCFFYKILELPDGRVLSWQGNTDDLQLWNATFSRFIRLEGHFRITGRVILLDDGHIVSCSEDGTLRLWDINFAPLYSQIAHILEINALVLLRDKTVLSWNVAEYDFHLWDKHGTHLSKQNKQESASFLKELQETERVNFKDHLGIDPIMFTEKLFIDVQYKVLRIIEAETNTLVCTFYGDAKFLSVKVIDDVVIAGDVHGRVIFLRWVE